MDTQNRPKRMLSSKSKLLMLILVIGVLVYNHETIEFYLFYKYACLASAVDIGQGKKLGVCGRHSYDNGSSVPDDVAIIYDSSDQLLLPDKERSQEWLKAAEKLNMRRVGIKTSWLPTMKPDGSKVYGPPKTIIVDTFDNIIPLGGHFYHVNGVGSY